ncbi:MAG TPA: HemK/PrmC family methyltransferase [Candidatus Baltobacteraceae bacterium]|nr:HemK/PrmC family methyltransferase [Candidatus Baltobacteraceae bacterium]
MKLHRPNVSSFASKFLPADCCPDVESALGSAALLLETAGVETARLDAECLLANVLTCPRWQLTLEPARRLVAEEFARFLTLLQRRERREPLAYILEEREFWSLPLRVTSDVLIPRPETEILVETALKVWRDEAPRATRQAPGGEPRAAGREPHEASSTGHRASGDEPRTAKRGPMIVDLCTGTGAVAIALAREIPDARVFATDLSAQALRIAERNVAAHGLSDRVHCLRGNLWRAVNGHLPAGADLVVANPPYIKTGDLAVLMPEIGWEPRLALDGGVDGLRLIREIIETTPDRLRAGGSLLLEIGDEQASPVLALFGQEGRYDEVHIVADLAGRPRVAVAHRAGGIG